VNPLAVNSEKVNVFTGNLILMSRIFINFPTENKRAVTEIISTDFGHVAYVTIGATMVGSIIITSQQDSHVER
jgi:phosphatidylserine decarboxylase